MRILSIHSDRISYKAKMKAKMAEFTEKREDSMDQCMVFFSCVERLDEADPRRVGENAVEWMVRRLEQVKARGVMIFPYAHLSSTLASPHVALQVLKDIEERLKDKGYGVKRAPFGWYKEFELKTKGHPMAELYLSIGPYDASECDPLCPCCGGPIRGKDAGRAGEG
ncbi:MAG: threonyl-tRNA synthetase editing domain-containing protein, partial [Methanotrichaceae archaeon]|nr:threonyl-tRNA synthetase editing domain-containing protein [Methanotrichaceae archaeon]